MTPQEAQTILDAIAFRYSPRRMPWQDSDGSVNPDAISIWIAGIAPYPSEAVMRAVNVISEQSPEWPANFNVFQRAVQQEARNLITRNREAIGGKTVRCDGSGMIRRSTGHMPCPVCNPFLYSEWSDGHWNDFGPARKERWESWQERNGRAPDPCKPALYDMPEAVGPMTGIAIMGEAYEEECERLGREPRKLVVEKWAQRIESLIES